MGTDQHWELWGAHDPYYGVLTNPRYRASELTPAAKAEFMATGQAHVDYVLQTIHTRFAPAFRPASLLEFGCGVGRLLIPFARVVPNVVGVDVSPSMLAEARRNCDDAGIAQVSLLSSDDDLSTVQGCFDLVHSCIVLQHIEIPRGRRLFQRLVQRVAPGGCGALHVTIAWDRYPNSFGQPPSPLHISEPPNAMGRPPVVAPPGLGAQLLAMLGLQRSAAPVAASAALHEPAAPALPPGVDPEMQMNYYNLSELTYILQCQGVHQMQVDLTNHGGALGAFIFFHKPA